MAAGGTLIKTQDFNVTSSTPKWLVSARNDIGTKEWVRNTSTPNPVVQAFYQKAMKSTALIDVTDQPWCAYYVGAKLVDAGYPSSRSGMARSYMRYGDEVDKSDTSKWKAGDIVVFWRGKRNDGVQGHVAFLVSWDATYVYVLGGNQGDKVSLMRNARSKILAVRRPRAVTQSRTIQATAGSAASQAAGKGVATFVPDHVDVPSLVSPAHADALPFDASTLAPTNAPSLPSPDDLQAAYDQAHPYIAMLQSIKPELIVIFTIISMALAGYACYCRYKDWKEGHNT